MTKIGAAENVQGAGGAIGFSSVDTGVGEVLGKPVSIVSPGIFPVSEGPIHKKPGTRLDGFLAFICHPLDHIRGLPRSQGGPAKSSPKGGSTFIDKMNGRVSNDYKIKMGSKDVNRLQFAIVGNNKDEFERIVKNVAKTKGDLRFIDFLKQSLEINYVEGANAHQSDINALLSSIGSGAPNLGFVIERLMNFTGGGDTDLKKFEGQLPSCLVAIDSKQATKLLQQLEGVFGKGIDNVIFRLKRQKNLSPAQLLQLETFEKVKLALIKGLQQRLDKGVVVEKDTLEVIREHRYAQEDAAVYRLKL